MSGTRRQALRMLGAVGATCAFPFAGDELYGQHVHAPVAQAPASGPYAPTFFTAGEHVTLSRLVDAIIPPTDTAGATAAGVPEYIDRVITLNKEHQSLMRDGLAWLERQAQSRYSREFAALLEAEQIAILQPLSDAIDRERAQAQQRLFAARARAPEKIYYVAITDRDVARAPSSPRKAPGSAGDLPARFFRLVKHLTADGYYTSRLGLLEELGYAGNRALAQFPPCSVPEQ